jgi:uncharacterized protein YlxW (UPF0749 family)
MPDVDQMVTPDSGRERLARALLARPSWGQVLIAILVGVVGFAATTQVRLNSHDNEFVGSRGQDLVVMMDSLIQSNARARAQIQDLERVRSQLSTSRSQRILALGRARRRLDTLGILAGTVAAVGPGVTVTISGPAGAVTASILLDAIEELRDAGAEAMQIDHRARVVASTALTESAGVVYVDGTAVPPPYVIDVIGSPQTLRQAVTFRGGLTDQVHGVGGQVTVVPSPKVRVTSLHKIVKPQYSRPAK